MGSNLVDLLRIDGAYDSEGLGLYYFYLDIHEILNAFTDEEIEEAFAQYNCRMSKEELNILMQVVFGIFKVAPAINYVKSTLTPEEKRKF